MRNGTPSIFTWWLLVMTISSGEFFATLLPRKCQDDGGMSAEGLLQGAMESLTWHQR
jgi:hypothetical protein